MEATQYNCKPYPSYSRDPCQTSLHYWTYIREFCYCSDPTLWSGLAYPPKFNNWTLPKKTKKLSNEKKHNTVMNVNKWI